MNLNRLLLTAILAVSTCGVYAQVTYGKPVARAFTGKTHEGQIGGKPSVGKISNQGNANNNNSVSNNTTSSTQFTDAQVAKANTAKDATYLSQTEKDVILYCNLARLDGQTFANQYLGKLKGSSNSYEQSLLSDLAKVKNLPMLKSNSKLAKAAKYHVDDIGPKGLVQHESSDGTNCGNRVRKYYKGGYIGENIDFGRSSAMDIVLDLLIDDGIESLGHRKNILNGNFSRIGVSIGSHKQYQYCCVQDFADDAGDTEDNTVKPDNNKPDNNKPDNNNTNVTNNNREDNVNPSHPDSPNPNRPRPDRDRYDDDDDDDSIGGLFGDLFDGLFDDDDDYCDDDDDYYTDDDEYEDDDYFDDDDCNYYDDDEDFDFLGWF